MKKLCEFYVGHAKVMGFLYCAVPTVAWFGFMMTQVAFRPVYLGRLALAVVVGGLLAAWFNDYGLRLWLLRHRSAAGPAGSLDGFLIGAAIGLGICVLPPLTALIGTHHPEQAKTFIIVCYLAGAAIGGLNGAVLGAVGRQHVARGDGGSGGPG